MSSAVLFLDEELHPTDLVGGALVVAGILYGAMAGRVRLAGGRPRMWSRVRWAHGRGRASHSVP